VLARLEAQDRRRLRSWLKWAAELFLFGLITHGHLVQELGGDALASLLPVIGP